MQFMEVKNKMAQRAVWSPREDIQMEQMEMGAFSKSVPGYNPIQIEETPQVIGGQMCSWEQSGEVEIPVLRKDFLFFGKSLE